MIRWALFSILASALLYGMYVLLFRRDRWLQVNRFYLLVAMFFCIVFPLVQLPKAMAPSALSASPTVSLMLDTDIDVYASATPTMSRLEDLLPAVYMFGMVATLAMLLFQLIVQTLSIISMRRKYPVYHSCDGYDIPDGSTLVLVPDNTAPYSFFNHIVVGTRNLSDEELRCILAHESHHVCRAHSFDIILMRVMCCVLWFNPFAWLLTQELRSVHEYQADASALAAYGRDGYLKLLYRQVTGIGYGHITNNFQSINLKQRIAMMKQKKSRFGAWKLLAALPVVAMLMLVGCKHAPAADTDAEPAVEPAAELTDITTVDVDPSYPGGVEELYKYIAENVNYPEAAKAAGEEGRVFVRFVVETDGSVSDAEVVRGIGGECDAEALRVINSMPKWTPAMKDGNPVRVNYTIPITFKLN